MATDRHAVRDDYLSVADIFRLILNGKYVILATIAICCAVSLAVSYGSTNIYRASYIVTPPGDDAQEAFGGVLNQLSFFADEDQGPDFSLYLDLLASERVARKIAARDDIVSTILPNWEEGFDPAGPVDRETYLSLAVSGYLSRRVSIAETQYPSHYAVVLDSPYPQTALAIITLIHAQANDIVRNMRLQRALAQRDHLKEQLLTITITDYRAMLLQILSRVEAQIMTSSSEAEFAAEIADGPFVNPVPVFPRKRLFLIMAVIGGSILGLLLVVFTPLSDDIFRSRAGRKRAIDRA